MADVERWAVKADTMHATVPGAGSRLVASSAQRSYSRWLQELRIPSYRENCTWDTDPRACVSCTREEISPNGLRKMGRSCGATLASQPWRCQGSHPTFPRIPSAPTRNRTENLLIKSQLLYQLSYRRERGKHHGAEGLYARRDRPLPSTIHDIASTSGD